MVARGVVAYSLRRIQNREQVFVFSQKMLISLALFPFHQRQAALRRRFQYFYLLNCVVGLGVRSLSSGSRLEHLDQPLNRGLYLLGDRDEVNIVNGVVEEQWRIVKRRH